MLRWAFLFLVLAIVAGILGFTGAAGDSTYIAKVLLFVFLAVFLVSLVYSFFTKGRPGAL